MHNRFDAFTGQELEVIAANCLRPGRSTQGKLGRLWDELERALVKSQWDEQRRALDNAPKEQSHV